MIENDFSKISSESQTDRLSQISSEEAYIGWPGDGSGMDDLADFNQMEAFDYCYENE